MLSCAEQVQNTKHMHYRTLKSAGVQVIMLKHPTKRKKKMIQKNFWVMSLSREDDTSPENLRLKLKSGQSERSSDKRRDSDSESHDAQQSRSASRSRRDKDGEAGDRPDRSSSHSRRDKETKIKSQVVVKKSENQDSDDSGDDSESNWFSCESFLLCCNADVHDKVCVCIVCVHCVCVCVVCVCVGVGVHVCVQARM